MIAFDLTCSQGHCFEGWFDSADDFEQQKARGLVACPICEDLEISRLLSPIRSLKGGGQDGPQIALSAQAVQELVAHIQGFVKSNFEDVGPDFAKEALKIHYGASPQRSIRGVSTGREEEMLREEGIEFFKLPLPSKDLD